MAHSLATGVKITHGQHDKRMKDDIMPYVNVRITKDGVTKAQKAQIVKEITQTLQRVLGKQPEHTHIIIDEVDLENWGFTGILTTEYRQQQE